MDTKKGCRNPESNHFISNWLQRKQQGGISGSLAAPNLISCSFTPLVTRSCYKGSTRAKQNYNWRICLFSFDGNSGTFSLEKGWGKEFKISCIIQDIRITFLKKNFQVFLYSLKTRFPDFNTSDGSLFILENNLEVSSVTKWKKKPFISCNINSRSQEISLEIANIHISNICTLK